MGFIIIVFKTSEPSIPPTPFPLFQLFQVRKSRQFGNWENLFFPATTAEPPSLIFLMPYPHPSLLTPTHSNPSLFPHLLFCTPAAPSSPAILTCTTLSSLGCLLVFITVLQYPEPRKWACAIPSATSLVHPELFVRK